MLPSAENALVISVIASLVISMPAPSSVSLKPLLSAYFGYTRSMPLASPLMYVSTIDLSSSIVTSNERVSP